MQGILISRPAMQGKDRCFRTIRRLVRNQSQILKRILIAAAIGDNADCFFIEFFAGNFVPNAGIKINSLNRTKLSKIGRCHLFIQVSSGNAPSAVIAGTRFVTGCKQRQYNYNWEQKITFQNLPPRAKTISRFREWGLVLTGIVLQWKCPISNANAFCQLQSSATGIFRLSRPLPFRLTYSFPPAVKVL